MGGVSGEESVSEASLALFIFAFRAVFQPLTNIGSHRWPKIVPGHRGINFGVGEVVEIGVVLAGKGFAESGRNDDAGREIGVTVNVKAIAGGNGVRIERGEAIGIGELGGLPFVKGGGEVVVAGRGENFEERGGAEQDLREDLQEVGERGDVADEPEKIGVEEHHFSSLFVQGAKARLGVELVVVGDAGRQIRR